MSINPECLSSFGILSRTPSSINASGVATINRALRMHPARAAQMNMGGGPPSPQQNFPVQNNPRQNSQPSFPQHNFQGNAPRMGGMGGPMGAMGGRMGGQMGGVGGQMGGGFQPQRIGTACVTWVVERLNLRRESVRRMGGVGWLMRWMEKLDDGMEILFVRGWENLCLQ